jgi:hypothetical protein
MITFSRRFRLWWSAGCLAVAGVLLAYDAAARSWALWQPLAPSAAALWWSVAAGAIIGTALALHERWVLRSRRDVLLRLHAASVRERVRPPLLGDSLRLSAGALVAFLPFWALILYCALNDIDIGPMTSVMCSWLGFNAGPAEKFRSEVEQRVRNAAAVEPAPG